MQAAKAAPKRAAPAIPVMAFPTPQQAINLVRKWGRLRDLSEVLPLYGLLAMVLPMGVYTTGKVYFNEQAGSFTNTTLRGDYEKQVEAAGTLGDPAHRKRTIWYKLAQYKVDEDGANVGIFDNRTRPHQYSKPGFAGTAAGMPA